MPSAAFFSSIDWGLLEAGLLPAPFVPSSDEINAESTEDIGVIDDRKFAKVKLTEEFQAQLEPFHFKSITSLQQEMVEILKKVDEGINFEKFSAQVACLWLFATGFVYALT